MIKSFASISLALFFISCSFAMTHSVLENFISGTTLLIVAVIGTMIIELLLIFIFETVTDDKDSKNEK